MSKALEALNDLREVKGWNDNEFDNRLDIIENSLKRLETLEEEKQSFDRQLEKKLKALEIIKEKCEFDFLEEKINDMPVKYEIHIRPKNKEQLLFNCLAIFPKTQEEYDLLKEILL